MQWQVIQDAAALAQTYDPLARGAHGNSLEHKAARAILFLAAHETVLAWIGNNLGTSSALRRSSLLDSRRYEAIASERLGEECSAKGSCIFRANQADVTHRKSDDRGCITVGHGLISPQDRNEGHRIGAGRPVMPALADALSIAYASLWHFLMKLVLAAPASGLPFLSMAFGSQTSLAHFVMKLFKAAPASGLPSLPIALLWQDSSALAGLIAIAPSRSARPNLFMKNLLPGALADRCAATHRLFDSADDRH